MSFKAVPANRQAAPISAAFIGESGSGKTYSALLFARGLVGPEGTICVIDTEGKRALMYADDPEIGGFLHIDFPPLYSSDRFKEAVKTAVDSGADAIIIDSASHEHEAEGGLLDFADREEARLGAKAGMRKWIKPKMAHNRFVRFCVSCSPHMLFCLRQTNSTTMENNKPVSVKSTVCEKNLIFDLDLAIELEPKTHKAIFVKVPKPFQNHIRNGEVLTVEHGKLLMKEAGQGEKPNKALQDQLHILDDLVTMGVPALKRHYDSLNDDTRRLIDPHIQAYIDRAHREAEASQQMEHQTHDDRDFPGDIPPNGNGNGSTHQQNAETIQ